VQNARRSSQALAALLAASSTVIAQPAPNPAAQAKIAAVYSQLPLSFEANEGQVSADVDFLCRGAGMTLFLSGGEALLSLRGPEGSQVVVRMQPIGAAYHPRGVGVEPQITKTNYFLGNDPQQWHTDIANFGQVRYPQIYPGIDLIYRGNQRRLEYDLMIAPGADPNQIRLAISGAGSIRIDPLGGLILRTAAGDLEQPAPTVYQEGTEGRQRVAGRYALLASPDAPQDQREGGRQQVGFVVGRYDHSRPLIIDPVIVYSTFLGGSGEDSGQGIAVDGSGNAYVTGVTQSTTFPGVTGSSIQPAYGGGKIDAFVTKINAAGTAIVYSTFLGGGDNDAGAAIAVDGTGNAYVTGDTQSTDFPVTASSTQPTLGGGHDAFVTKINAAGTAIVYSTFVGGSGDDSGRGIAVDGSGNAYVTGSTQSTTFPGVTGSSIQPANGGGFDAFVTEINAAGTAIVYSTFLGGNGSDLGYGIAVDSGGNAYITGHTSSTTFPGVTGGSIQPAFGGVEDAFVTKINAAGTAIVYSTFLGGSGDDLGNGIAVDGPGNAYITGQTFSTTFPGVSGSSIQPASAGGGDAFVTKINAGGTAIVYSTFLGGSGGDAGYGIAVDGTGNAYITGETTSTTFPGVTGSSIQPANGGFYDAFVTKINAAGTAIDYSTFLGGSGDDHGFGIALDSAGNAYITGLTSSTTFLGITGSSIQPANGGGSDAFVTKIGSPGFTAAIPALGSLGMVLLALLLAAGGVLLSRARS
jgi:hypothetical protein